MVIRYSYLWQREHERGQEEGVKDRPCAIILVVKVTQECRLVTVLPITHTPPTYGSLALEISYPTKQRLGLDAQRSWVVLNEANQFVWPGYDLRMKAPGGSPESVVIGPLPRALFRDIRGKFADAVEARLARIVRRTE